MKLDSVARFVAKYRTGMLQIILKQVIFNCTYTIKYNCIWNISWGGKWNIEYI